MPAALLLTGFALLGIATGILFHRSISNYLALAGALLLLVVTFVWILPEAAPVWGWGRALLLVAGVVVILSAADWGLIQLGHSPRHGVILPLLVATGIHSFLDGWSIRALATQPVPMGLVPIGLGLHKLPEGFALGWVLRRATPSHARAFSLGSAAEAFTLLGALYEPSANRLGLARFGEAWTGAVLCVIAGAFLFLSGHALLPFLKKHVH